MKVFARLVLRFPNLLSQFTILEALQCLAERPMLGRIPFTTRETPYWLVLCIMLDTLNGRVVDCFESLRAFREAGLPFLTSKLRSMARAL